MSDTALPELEASLEHVVAREIAAGNAVESRGEAADGRATVRLQRPFHDEYRTTLGAGGIYFRRVVMRDERAEYPFDDEILETARGIVSAPTPPSDEIRERAARVQGLRKASCLKDGPPPKHEIFATIADAIERELKRLHVWIEDPPAQPPKFSRAFGGDAMPFTHWIQLVMLPRLREIARSKGRIPGQGVAAYAVRELDGQDEYGTLLARLSALDALCSPASLPIFDRRDGRFQLAVIALAVIAIPLALLGVRLANEVNEAIDRRMPDGIVVQLEITGIQGADVHGIEARVEGVIEEGDAFAPEVFSLVTARTSALRVLVRPIDFTRDRGVDAGAIEKWLVASGAKVGVAATSADAERLRGIATVLLGTNQASALPSQIGVEIEGARVRATGEPFRFSRHASDAIHNSILIALLFVLLLPILFFAPVLRRRFVLA